jgi:hypothetical protein
LSSSCVSLIKNGSFILNPCGLIANSFFTGNKLFFYFNIIFIFYFFLIFFFCKLIFNYYLYILCIIIYKIDIFQIDETNSSPSTITLDESGIAWSSDKDKFKQVDGFKSTVVLNPNVTCESVDLPSSCKTYNDTATNTIYKFYYPNDETVQYLYETYPNQISPIDGVTDEHFKVWMRTAALPNFRKLYGKIDTDFNKNDKITFKVTANYEVGSFSSKKYLVISTIGEFGGRNPYLGVAYIVVGTISLTLALLFAGKQFINPRTIADPLLLNWN